MTVRAPRRCATEKSKRPLSSMTYREAKCRKPGSKVVRLWRYASFLDNHAIYRCCDWRPPPVTKSNSSQPCPWQTCYHGTLAALQLPARIAGSEGVPMSINFFIWGSALPLSRQQEFALYVTIFIRLVDAAPIALRPSKGDERFIIRCGETRCPET